jgi:hypothetical protein
LAVVARPGKGTGQEGWLRPVSSGAVTNSEDASVGTVVVAVAVNLLVGVGRPRRRLLSVPAVAAVEVTPVERAS